jgi:hypothetical protein
MAINRISGNILADDLRRGANLAVQGNLIYFDISNDRVGILTSSPQEDFDIEGNLRVGNVTVYEQGNIDAGLIWINNLQDPLAPQDSATKNYVDNVVSNVNIVISDGANTQQIFNGNVITFLAVANQTAIEVTATNNVTVGLADNVTINQALTVQGNLSADNLLVNLAINSDSIAVQGNISGNYLNINSISTTDITASGNIEAAGNITANELTANIMVADTANIGNLTFTDTTIGTANSGTNIVLSIQDPGLAVIDTTTGLILPSGNTAQQPVYPSAGTVRFNTDSATLELWNGSAWLDLSENLSNLASQVITGDAANVTFDLDYTTTSTGIIVNTNGVLQLPDVAYSVSGNQITFAEAPLESDTIEVRFVSRMSTVTAITNISGNARVETLSNAPTVGITGNLVPAVANVYSLGTAANRWSDLYLSGSTLTLGNILIKNITGNVISFLTADGVTPAVLDANAEIVSDAIQSGNSAVEFDGVDGNLDVSINGNTLAVFSAEGLALTGNIQAGTVTANVIGGFLQVAQYANATVRDSAIPVPAAGMVVLTGNVFQGYTGAGWINFTGFDN